MITEKKFVTQDGVPITAMTTFEPQYFIFFHRDLPDEKPVPFPIGILYQDERILVVDKPHFLSSIPRGQHVLESVVVKLRTQLQMPELTVAHRLDRVTSGVLMLTCARQWRCPYQTLFERRQVRKTYRLVAPWLDFDEMDDGPLGVIGDSPSGSAHGFGRLGEDETATSPDVAASRDSSATAFGDSAHDGDAISVTSQDHREQECSPEGRDDLFGQDTSESNCAGQYVKTKSNGLPHKDGDQSLTSGQRRDPSDPGDRAISVTSSQGGPSSGERVAVATIFVSHRCAPARLDMTTPLISSKVVIGPVLLTYRKGRAREGCPTLPEATRRICPAALCGLSTVMAGCE